MGVTCWAFTPKTPEQIGHRLNKLNTVSKWLPSLPHAVFLDTVDAMAEFPGEVCHSQVMKLIKRLTSERRYNIGPDPAATCRSRFQFDRISLNTFVKLKKLPSRPISHDFIKYISSGASKSILGSQARVRNPKLVGTRLSFRTTRTRQTSLSS